MPDAVITYNLYHRDLIQNASALKEIHLYTHHQERMDAHALRDMLEQLDQKGNVTANSPTTFYKNIVEDLGVQEIMPENTFVTFPLLTAAVR